MRGFCAGGTGQGVASAQSKSDGHWTLNENGIVLRRGSKPTGGVSLHGQLTTCKVYCELSPLYFVRMTRNSSSGASPSTRLAGALGGCAFAIAVHAMSTDSMRSPTSMMKLS